MNTLFLVPGIFLLVVASAFFSGAEVALFSVDKKQLSAAVTGNPLIQRYLFILLDAPRRLLITILIGNTLVNILVSILTAMFAIQYAEVHHLPKDLMITLQIVLVTLLLLVFGEVTPKVLSARHPVPLAKFYAVPLYFVSMLLYPVSELFSEGIRTIVSKIAVHSKFHTLSGDEIPFLAALGHEKGTLEDEEHDLIQGLVSTKTKIVREIMRHRTNIFAVPYDLPFNNLIETIKDAIHSRIPVYEDSLDNIKGILYAKDLLKFLRDPAIRETFSMEKVLRKPLIVPETKLINELMRDFQEKKLHVAIVVDEYGGTSGLVTLEDIIEEVVGEIRDEFDTADEFIKQTGDKSYLVSGSIPIKDFAAEFGLTINFSDKEYETAAGWIYDKLGIIPKKGDLFVYENCKITIADVKNNRIKAFTLDKPV